MRIVSLDKALSEMEVGMALRAAKRSDAKSDTAEQIQGMLDTADDRYKVLSILALMVRAQTTIPGIEMEGVTEEAAIEAVGDNPLAFNLGLRAGINGLLSALTEYAALERMREHFPTPPTASE